MVGSLVFALIISPMLADFLLKKERSRDDGPSLSQRLEDRLLAWYRPMVTFFVQRERRAIGLAASLLAVGMACFPFLGSEFTPTLQEGTLVLRLTMAPSISLENSMETALMVERRLMRIPEVTGVVSRTGRGEVGAHTDPVNSSEMYLMLAPEEDWSVSTQAELRERLRNEMGNIPGVLTNFTQPIQMTVDELLEGVRAELAIKLFGDDLEVLKRVADDMAAVVSRVDGAEDVQPDQISGTPQLQIRIDRDAIARYGVNVEDVQQTIRTAVGGAEAGQIFEGVRRFDIYVRYESASRSTPESIGQLLIPAPSGARVPLAELASIENHVGPRQITRENNQRFITIQLNVDGRDIGSFVQEAREALDREIDLPVGYTTSWGGQFRLQQEANARLMVVVPITFALAFLLLYVSFQSLGSALLIALNVPMALVGGVVALFLSGQNLSVPSSVGFIALFGVSLQNGMVMVSCLNQRLKAGLSVEKAAVEGALLRLRPVLMTAVTTTLGLVPLLLSDGTGSEVQQPLAIVVVGGMVTSTVLTLLVIPSLYRRFHAVV
jgi:cobalt-zinc-cadmium resistance protein CzcA